MVYLHLFVLSTDHIVTTPHFWDFSILDISYLIFDFSWIQSPFYTYNRGESSIYKKFKLA